MKIQIGLATIVLLIIGALVGAAPASATELYGTAPPNDTLGAGTEITATLKSSTSLLLKDTLGGANDTCTSSEVKNKIETAGSSTTNPSGKVSGLTFSSCSHTTTVIKNADGFFGELEIKNIAGTTNGTVISKGTRVTVKSTIFGVSCVANTGAGTTLGTLTGAKSSEVGTLDVNAVITMENGCGDSTLTGTYLITSPTGLMVEATGTGSVLYRSTPSVTGTLGKDVEITATLETGTSTLLKDTFGVSVDTCTSSQVKGTVESLGSTTTHPSGNISSLTFGGCSEPTVVLANGSLEISNIAGTTNGTVIAKSARVSIKNTIFGINCVANTGVGTVIGTLTGSKSGNAPVMDINGVITLENSCGDATWTGTYLVTAPTDLTVEAS